MVHFSNTPERILDINALNMFFTTMNVGECVFVCVCGMEIFKCDHVRLYDSTIVTNKALRGKGVKK